ncbi:zinc-binding dehydrogenase [Streptomyces sp. NPDC058459]|uniref:zinc-binding dehydrogenase n=1 Tax=Streptomyces sp. NPDC058459 TaxID=3346508 RepID=UPI00365D7BD9
MHAVRLHAFGPAENLTYERTDDPSPGPGQVRIAVAAAGVHLLDTALREGRRGPLPERPTLPTVPGREVAGVVDALGAGVDGAWLGRRVVAHLGFAPGGYAELAVTDAARLHAVPEGLGLAEAVAMIGSGRTALGVAGFAEPGPESVVVVPAAAGGIGMLLVQHARNAGATVVGLAGGGRKTALVRANGADLAVDYTRPDWAAEVRAGLGARAATLVYDGVGGEVAREAVALLGPGGRHLVFGWSAEGIGEEGRGHFVAGVSESVLGPELVRRGGGLRALEERALAEAAAGRLRPAVTRFPLAGAAAAHRALQTRGTVGKVVLEP